MTLTPRIIPILQLSDSALVKTHQFERPKYLGDPMNAVRILSEMQADEIIVIDILASAEGRGPNIGLLSAIAHEAQIPLTFGGGVSSADVASAIIAVGFEKVAVQGILQTSPRVLEEISAEIGSQAVVASIDIRQVGPQREPTAFWQRGSISSGLPASAVIELALRHGAGEVLLTDIAREGTRSGARPEILKDLKGLEVPLIFNGGVASFDDVRALLAAGCDAVAAGAWFLFRESLDAVIIDYPLLEDRPTDVNTAFELYR